MSKIENQSLTRVRNKTLIIADDDYVQEFSFPNNQQILTWKPMVEKTLGVFQEGQEGVDYIELSVLSKQLNMSRKNTKLLINKINRGLRSQTDYQIGVDSLIPGHKLEVKRDFVHIVRSKPAIPAISEKQPEPFNYQITPECFSERGYQVDEAELASFRLMSRNALKYLQLQGISEDTSQKNLIEKLSKEELTSEEVEDDIEVKLLAPTLETRNLGENRIFRLGELVTWIAVSGHEDLATKVFKTPDKLRTNLLYLLQQVAQDEITKQKFEAELAKKS